MLVEINLLPKKEPRDYTRLVIILSFIFVIVAASVYFYFTYNGYKKEIASYNQQIEMTRQLAGIEQSKVDAEQRVSSVQQLQDLIEWSEDDAVKSVPLLKHLVSLLPERGFFMNFNYASEENVQLTVQFDTAREAAEYLHALYSSDWISQAKLTSLETENMVNKQEQNQSNTTQSNTENSGQTTNDNKQDTEIQLENSQYVPRYLGVFDLSINKAYMKQQQEQASSEEGELEN